MRLPVRRSSFELSSPRCPSDNSRADVTSARANPSRASTTARASGPILQVPAWCQAVPPLASLAIIVVLRDANGPEHSVYAAFALLPVFWFALYGTLPQLLTCIAGVTLAVGLPVAIAGPPEYPAADLVFAGLLAMFAVLIGVTVQRLVRAVRESEAETRSILESAHEAFISMDTGGRIVEWNARAQKEFGWSRDEVIGRQLVDTIVPQRFRAQHRAGIARSAGHVESPVFLSSIGQCDSGDGGNIPSSVAYWSLKAWPGLGMNAARNTIRSTGRAAATSGMVRPPREWPTNTTGSGCLASESMTVFA